MRAAPITGLYYIRWCSQDTAGLCDSQPILEGFAVPTTGAAFQNSQEQPQPIPEEGTTEN